MNLENSIEVGSVSEFLDAVKQIYCDQDHQLFYRGVSKKVYFKSPSLEYKPKPQYIAQQYARLIIGNETIKKSFYSLEKAQSLFNEQSNDHPGIYRNKNLIENEDKMFYELTAKCPEYFKDCKTTFEHLVMMQHYGYPTRLLDITSNPLVALYFACGGLNGSNSEDGQLISYHIKKNDIRNYDSDRVSLLSNLSFAHQKLNYVFFVFAQLNTILKDSLKSKEIQFIRERAKNFENLPCVQQALIKLVLCHTSIGEDLHLLQMKVKSNTDLIVNKDMALEIINNYQLFATPENYNGFVKLFYGDEKHKINDEERQSELKNNLKLIENMMSSLEITLLNMRETYEKFMYRIKNEKPFFNSLAINSLDMRTIQCVLPKQNNPRLIAQQGAFLLFGFKDAASDKTATPIIPNKMYGTAKTSSKKNSCEKIKIIIKSSEKQKILDELKILGISNSTMFPEIDNIANELKNQYAKPR